MITQKTSCCKTSKQLKAKLYTQLNVMTPTKANFFMKCLPFSTALFNNFKINSRDSPTRAASHVCKRGVNCMHIPNAPHFNNHIRRRLEEDRTLKGRELLEQPPASAWKNQELKSIPLLIGSAAQAVDFWPGPDDLPTWTWNQYKKYVTTSLDSFGLQVSQMALRIYNGTALQSNSSNFTAEYLYTTMVSDIRQSCPVNTLANQLSKVSHSPIYRYILTERPSNSVRLFNYSAKYSFHMWDLIAFFGDMETFLANPDQDDEAFAEVVQNMVSNFVKSSGDSVGDSDWLRFPKKIANLARNITFGSINKTECKFWSESKLDVYAWVS
ncbi:hypothetical protein HNY73_021010 [Argiope bruennichi]|uniref:Carboxylesterase type B domain-containing protein n=1 Tax=Argiope bruennichi TaxID=94029 RepID=A0A8T0EBE8_ARGBR|nr:hypothetical protein HNY73_021010 [Argiope bruennichi]